MIVNYKYSNKDFTGRTLVNIGAYEFNNTIIENSCFWQENHPELKKVFPAGMTGVVFRRCNLDNVEVPATCTIENYNHRMIMVQNDLIDWEVDAALKPLKPIWPRLFDEFSLRKDPKDIPITKQTISVIQQKTAELKETE